MKNEYLYKFYKPGSGSSTFLQSQIIFDLRTLGAVAKLSFGSEKANFYLGAGYYKGVNKFEDRRVSMTDEPPYFSSSDNWLGMGYEAGFEFKIAKINVSLGYAALLLSPVSGDFLFEEYDFSGPRASLALEF